MPKVARFFENVFAPASAELWRGKSLRRGKSVLADLVIVEHDSASLPAYFDGNLRPENDKTPKIPGRLPVPGS
jgi:hypothetical protein